MLQRNSLQSRNRDSNVEDKRMDTKGESRGWLGSVGGGMNWEIDIYILICIK